MRGLLLTGLITAVFSSSASAADEVIDPVGSSPSAYGGVVAWNHVVGGETTALRVLHNGVVKDIRSTREYFDPSVGPGPDGKPVVVYNWCKYPQRSNTKFRGCDIYLYDVAKGRTRKLRSISSTKRREESPVIWRNKVVFYGGREGHYDYPPKLYVGDLRRGSVRRVRVGPIKVFNKGDEPTPIGASIRGNQILTSWEITPEPVCQDYVDPDPQPPPVPLPPIPPGMYDYDHGDPTYDPTNHGRWEVWSTSLKKRPSHKRLVRSCDFISSPLFVGPLASWPRDSHPDSVESRVGRLPINSGFYDGVAIDGSAFYLQRPPVPSYPQIQPPLVRVNGSATL